MRSNFHAWFPEVVIKAIERLKSEGPICSQKVRLSTEIPGKLPEKKPAK